MCEIANIQFLLIYKMRIFNCSMWILESTIIQDILTVPANFSFVYVPDYILWNEGVSGVFIVLLTKKLSLHIL